MLKTIRLKAHKTSRATPATAVGQGSFPYFQLGCLIIGGMTIISLKNKYEKMLTNEAVGAFALYTVLVALFTNPVIDAIKNLVS